MPVDRSEINVYNDLSPRKDEVIYYRILLLPNWRLFPRAIKLTSSERHPLASIDVQYFIMRYTRANGDEE